MIELTIPVWDIWANNALVIDVKEWALVERDDGRMMPRDQLTGLRRETALQCVATALGGEIRRNDDGSAYDVKVLIPDHSPLCARILRIIVDGNDRPGRDGITDADSYLKGEWLDTAREAIGAIRSKGSSGP